MQNFLDFHYHSPVSGKIAQFMKFPLSEEDMWSALKQMKPGKIPVLDGFTVQYFKSFYDVLLPHILQAFNSESGLTSHCRQILEANITVIPKGD